MNALVSSESERRYISSIVVVASRFRQSTISRQKSGIDLAGIFLHAFIVIIIDAGTDNDAARAETKTSTSTQTDTKTLLAQCVESSFDWKVWREPANDIFSLPSSSALTLMMMQEENWLP